MKLDPSLHKTLLAGLARAPLAPGSGAPAALQPVLGGDAQEARVWHTLAAADLWQRAGFQPLAAPAAPAACADEPTCPRPAEHVLHLILRGIRADLLDSWLALARSAGCRLPHAGLVPLLDMSMTRPALRAALAPLLGKRGEWLAAQNPAWSAAYGAGVAPEARWQLGNVQQRRDALTAMRRADPAAALAALAHEWPQEPPESRAVLLPCLATGLNLGDEAFLELALDDKRKEVRLAAQQLLATLPGSQLGERCKARLAAIFTLERKTGFAARLGAMLTGGGPPAQLTLQLPEAADKGMLRDGIGVQKHAGIGEKAGWVRDLMGCVSPVHWSSSWELSPKQVLDVLAANEFNTALVAGLVQAAGRAVRADAGESALDWFVTLVTNPGEAAHDIDIVPMLMPDLERLPQPLQERIVQRWLGEAHSQQHLNYLNALAWADRAAHPLSPDISRTLLATTRRHMESEPPSGFTRNNFSILEKVLDAGDLAYVHAGWPAPDWPHWPLWREPVDELMETLQFRHTMHRSFLENNA